MKKVRFVILPLLLLTVGVVSWPPVSFAPGEQCHDTRASAVGEVRKPVPVAASESRNPIPSAERTVRNLIPAADAGAGALRDAGGGERCVLTPYLPRLSPRRCAG